MPAYVPKKVKRQPWETKLSEDLDAEFQREVDEEIKLAEGRTAVPATVERHREGQRIALQDVDPYGA